MTTTLSPRDAALQRHIDTLGYSFDGEIRAGGDYAPVVRDGTTAWVSGQVPRVGTEVVVTGRVGATVTLEAAQRGAQVAAIRALLLLRRALGSLDAIQQVLKVGVYVQCTDAFTQHSEVADAASALLKSVLGEAGTHTRTSVGVYQLPKNASVEVDMVVRTDERA
jgi:enamine deaminase RidA (YjgF/YER057c/UK114 family)